MSQYIYVLSNSLYAKNSIYKVGKHSGSRSKLISRYKTPLIDPQIYLFLLCGDYTQAEREIKAKFQTKRIKHEGHYTEWVTLPLDELIVNKYSDLVTIKSNDTSLPTTELTIKLNDTPLPSEQTIKSNDTPLLTIKSNNTPLPNELTIKSNDTPLLTIKSNDTPLLTIKSNDTPLLTIKSNDTLLLTIKSNDTPLLTIKSNEAELEDSQTTTGMYRFYCSFCNYGTDKKHSYDVHLVSKKHYIRSNDIKINYCVACYVQFSNKSKYLAHLKNIHNEDTSHLVYQNYYLIDLPGHKETRQ